MIEAINASISAAPVARAIVAEASTSQSANPVRIQKAGVTAPYLSPHVRLTPDAKPVFVVRDVNTGAQIKQFPTEAQIRAYQKASEAKTTAVEAVSGEQQNITPEQARILIKTSVEFKKERAAVQYDTQVAIPGKSQASSEAAPAPVPGVVDEQA